MQALNFTFQPVQITIVEQHIMGFAQPLLTLRLCLKNGVYLLFANLVAGYRALNLQMFRSIHYQNSLGQQVLARLDQQWRDENGIGRLSQSQILADFLPDQRVQQSFQPASLFRILEDFLAQGRTIQLAITLQHMTAEMFSDFQQRWPPWLDYPARGVVCVDRVYTKLAEIFGGGALAAANAASQPENPGFHNTSRNEAFRLGLVR